MKKITLLVVAFVFAMTAQAQETSFESSEGYSLDPINGQNNWTTQDATASLFTVSDEDASDGDYSLKLATDENGLIQEGSITGPRLDVSSDISGSVETYSISVDIKQVGADAGGETDFIVQDQSENGATTSRVAIFGGNLNVVETVNGQPALVAQTPFSGDEYNTVTITYNFPDNEIIYSLNGSDFYTGEVYGGNTIGAYAFFTSGAQDYFVDNITVDEDPLGVKDFNKTKFTHYTVNNQLILSSDFQIGTIAIYNMLGQQVASQELNSKESSIGLSNLSSGIYLSKVNINGKTQSFKFVKN